MALNPAQKAQFEAKIEKMKEDGFFRPDLRSLSGNTRHLIISYGGTGADALFAVKELFEDSLPVEQLNERVRFLAIDTDKDTQKRTEEIVREDGTKEQVEVDALTDAQFFQLDGSLARGAVEPVLDANVAKWINPQLVKSIIADKKYLNGTGASGNRQVGRLTLYPAKTADNLTNRIRKLVGELTNNNTYFLKVFFLTGIAGGTGSGTVVDLTYLIRDAVPVLLKDRVQYGGFILLPPTGKTPDDPKKVHHGNSNGYAALKEINHFMTLKQRGDTYSFTYGNNHTVTSKEQIFDTCYLVDGKTTGMGFSNPREEACKVLAEGLLDMITASQTDSKTGATIQSVDSLMSDVSTFAKEMVNKLSVTHAPRDADYIYCSLGFQDFTMPANEVKAYVGKQFFDEIYNNFKKCSQVTEEDAKVFVADVIKRGVSTQSKVHESMDAEIATYFTNRKRGPFFTNNLLVLAVKEAERLKGQWKIARPGNVSDKVLDEIKSYASECNNNIFEAYTCAMNGLKSLMEDQFGAVVPVVNGVTTYSFLPLTLGKAENTQFVIEYLDGLIDEDKTKRDLCNNLLQEMINNKEKWITLINADLTGRNTAAAAMRKFWNDQLDKIVDSTMENLLLKYYSGDSTAHYSPENHEACKKHLDEAAAAIFNEMLGAGAKAEPLVQLAGSTMNLSDFTSCTYLMVPRTAPHLREALEKYAKTAMGNVTVCESLANDRISCYKQYSGLPAFKLHWVKEAEEAYEENLATDASQGLHMSDTVGGRQWRNFPNLLPRSTWGVLYAPHTNKRENGLADQAENLFADAENLKVVASDTHDAVLQIYHAKILPAEYRPKEALYKQLANANPGSDHEKQQLAAIDAAAEECAEKLFQKVEKWDSFENLTGDLTAAGVVFDKRELHFPNRANTVAAIETEEYPAWAQQLGKMMLRKLPETMSDLDATLKVMKLLEAKVRKSVMGKTLVKRFAQYVARDMFTYDAKKQNWNYKDENDVIQKLVYLDSEVEKQAEYYFMFNAFREDPLKIEKALNAQFMKLVPQKDDEDRAEKQKAFRDSAEKLAEKVGSWLNSGYVDIYGELAIELGYDVSAIYNFYYALQAEAKNMTIMGYREVSIAVGQEKQKEVVKPRIVIKNNGVF